MRISKYKIFFAKFYIPSLSEEIFVIKNVKNTEMRTYLTEDMNGEEIIGTFYQKSYKKNTKEFRIDKVIKERR